MTSRKSATTLIHKQALTENCTCLLKLNPILNITNFYPLKGNEYILDIPRLFLSVLFPPHFQVSLFLARQTSPSTGTWVGSTDVKLNESKKRIWDQNPIRNNPLQNRKSICQKNWVLAFFFGRQLFSSQQVLCVNVFCCSIFKKVISKSHRIHVWYTYINVHIIFIYHKIQLNVGKSTIVPWMVWERSSQNGVHHKNLATWENQP